MLQLVLILHVLIAISLVALVFMQHGKGADMGAAFGSGASQTLFGSRGSASFLMKLTGLLAALFFITSIALTYLISHQVKSAPTALTTMEKIPSSLALPQLPVGKENRDGSIPVKNVDHQEKN